MARGPHRDAREPSLFPYVEDPAGRRGRETLRPVVAVRLHGESEAPTKVAALVDSGSEHTLAAPLLARAIGIEPDESREFTIGIGGGARLVRPAQVTIELYPRLDTDDPPLTTWDTEVGFFATWEPPWAVLLGQVGFFDKFTVTMSRLAQALAIERKETFDERFGHIYRTVDKRSPRFEP